MTCLARRDRIWKFHSHLNIMKQLTFSLTLHPPSSLLDDYNLILYLLLHPILSHCLALSLYFC